MSSVSEVVVEAKREVVARFGARVRQVFLYGSVARGDAHSRSDVDLCFVIDDLSRREYVELVDVVSAVAVERDADLRPVCFSTKAFESSRRNEQPLVANILRDGIAI